MSDKKGFQKVVLVIYEYDKKELVFYLATVVQTSQLNMYPVRYTPHIHTHTHTGECTYTHKLSHTHSQALTHIHTCAHTHTLSHTHTHTYTHGRKAPFLLWV